MEYGVRRTKGANVVIIPARSALSFPRKRESLLFYILSNYQGDPRLRGDDRVFSLVATSRTGCAGGMSLDRPEFGRRLDNLDVVILKRIEVWQNVGIAADENNFFNAADADHTFADAAGVFADIDGCSFDRDAFSSCHGNNILLGAEPVANFAACAGFNILNISDAADFGAVVKAHRMIAVFHQSFVVFGDDCGDVRANATRGWREFIQPLQEFCVGGGEHKDRVRSAKDGVRSAKDGVRSVECGVRSAESENQAGHRGRSLKPGRMMGDWALIF